MPTTSEVKLYAFIGQAKNSYDKAPYMTGAQVDAQITAADADKDTDEVILSVNSGGGDVAQGNIIISSLMKCTKPTTAVIDGFAASMGYFVCLGAKKILASRNAMIMPHGVQSAISGSVQDIEAHVEVVKKFNQAVATLLVARTGLSEQEVLDKYLSQDTWLTAQEAFDQKLIDDITDYDAEIVDMPVANMSYNEFYAAYAAKISEEPSDNFIAKITAKVGAMLGLAPKTAAITAEVMELTDTEEYYLQSIINYLSQANEYADYISDQTANPQLKAIVKEILLASSQQIIKATIILYTEEGEDADAISARVKEIRAQVAAKQADTIMTAIKPDVDAKIASAVQPLQIQLDDVTAKYNAIKDLPGAAAIAAPRQNGGNTQVAKAIDDNVSLTDSGKMIAQLNSFDLKTARID